MNFRAGITVLTLIFNSQYISADIKVTGNLSNETAVFADNNYKTIGSDLVRKNDYVFKSETKFKLYFDGGIDNNFDYHTEFNIYYNPYATDNQFKSNEKYTQRDFIREFYFDSKYKDYKFRVGKQQVVLVANGIKLLDLINPTDFSEMLQNAPDEARIPIWALNIKTKKAGSDLQFVVSQPRENFFAGLNRKIDTSVRTNGAFNQQTGAIPDIAGIGHNQDNVFILKGIDTITGTKNGFLNITPDFGSVAAGFGTGFVNLTAVRSLSGLNNLIDNDINNNPYNKILSNFTVGIFTSGLTLAQLDEDFRQKQVDNGATVSGFANTYFGLSIAEQACADTNYTGCNDLTIQNNVTAVFNQVSNTFTGAGVFNDFGASYNSNLSSFGDGKRDSAFEYMTDTSFRTLDTFVNARSQYVLSMPDNFNVNLAFKANKSFDNGINSSIIFSHNYDPNPVINLSWRNDAGETLTKNTVYPTLIIRNPDFNESLPITAVNPATITSTGSYISLSDSQGRNYGGSYATDTYNSSPILIFEQTLKRARNIGIALDYALDIKNLNTFILKTEILHQANVYQPIVDLNKLAIGDLADAFEMTAGNRVKYIFGVDFNIFNMLIGTQYILDTNLDYVSDGNRYTADFASMHLTNGFRQADKNKRFYSLFLSKPFGVNKQHRWSNTFIYDEIQHLADRKAGKWNKFQVEYAFNDNTIANFESNHYYGGESSQFGQLKNSSNIQFGLEYRF